VEVEERGSLDLMSQPKGYEARYRQRGVVRVEYLSPVASLWGLQQEVKTGDPV